MMHRFVNYVHNDYLQVATETGIPALLAFLAFWFLTLGLPAPGAPPALRWGVRFGLVALMVHGLMDVNLTINHGSAFPVFVLAGVLHASAGAGVRASFGPDPVPLEDWEARR